MKNIKDRQSCPRAAAVKDAGKTLLVLLLATMAGGLFQLFGVGEANIIAVYILGVLLIAIWTPKNFYSICASLLGVLLFNFFFVAPCFTLAWEDAGYLITFTIMFIVSILTGSLTREIAEQAYKASKTAYRTQVLLDANRLLQKEQDIDKILSVAMEQLMKLLKRDVVLYAEGGEGLKEPVLFLAADLLKDTYEGYRAADWTRLQEPAEQKAASYAYWHLETSGATTGRFSESYGMYVPIKIQGMAYGVVGIPVESGHTIDTDENDLLLSIVSECALIVQNEVFREKEQEAQMRAQQEKFRADLLRSVSHDLRTPLTSISGNARILMGGAVDEASRARIYEDVYDDSKWLIHLVENLLTITKVENDTLIHKHTELLEEIVTEALKHVSRKISEHDVSVELQNDLEMVRVDSHLILQVIINIINNAVKYTQKGSKIWIRSHRAGNMVRLEIADNGPGIPREQKEKIFGMFMRLNDKAADSRRGLGLGLALCKSIITAHGGEIHVEDNDPKGAVFVIMLPAEEVAIHG